MIGIFLDDERTPPQVSWINYHDDITSWGVVRTLDEFKSRVNMVYILRCEYVVSFDHDIQDYDLNGKEVTGYAALKWLCDVILDAGHPLPKEVYFHTKNPVGKRNMEDYWENFKKSLESNNETR